MNRKFIEISGGLGNQMFQYVLGVELKLRGFYVTYDDRKILVTGNQHNGFELERVFKIDYHRKKADENITRRLIKTTLGKWKDEYKAQTI